MGRTSKFLHKFVACLQHARFTPPSVSLLLEWPCRSSRPGLSNGAGAARSTKGRVK